MSKNSDKAVLENLLKETRSLIKSFQEREQDLIKQIAFLSVKPKTQRFSRPAGLYAICDPCRFFKHAFMSTLVNWCHNHEKDLLDGAELTVDGVPVFLIRTRHGDGSYHVGGTNYNVFVDSGLLGIFDTYTLKDIRKSSITGDVTIRMLKKFTIVSKDHNFSMGKYSVKT